jgi:hypothetical protein
MAKMHGINLMITALVLGGGMLQSAGAQQTVDTPPTYDSARPSQSPDAAAGPGGSSSERLLVHSDRGIRYVSGGVGEGERAELDALSNQFNLRLLFAMQGSGEYLSAVRVNIRDARGEMVLTAESKGPWFFAQLAPGDYTVEASVPGQAQQQPQRQTAHIEGSRQSRLDFRWH